MVLPVFARCEHRIVLQIKIKQFYDQIMQNWYKQVKTQKSTNNPMSSFGFIEENMELSHIHLVVTIIFSRVT
jgi:hypothetical protein